MRAAVKAVALGFMTLALVASSVAGCGGPSAPPPPPPGGGAAGPPGGHPKKLIQDDALAEEEAVHTNPRWELIDEHFRRFTRRPASTHKDPFKSHLDKYVEKIEIPVDEDGGEEGPGIVEDKVEELDPLKKFPADEYKVVAIMTGVGIPAALLRDPKGNSHTVRVDAYVGNENGVVESITQYEVVIRMPEEPKPVRLNIRPSMIDVSQRQAEDRAVQTEVPDQLGD